MEISKDNIRVWLRKFYKCHWTFSKDTISINCDGEEFYINVSNLDQIDNITTIPLDEINKIVK